MTMRMMLLLLKELCHISLTKPHTHLCARPQGAKLLRTLRRRSTEWIVALRGSIECIVAVEEKYRRVHCCINVLGKGGCVPGIVGGQTHWPAPLPAGQREELPAVKMTMIPPTRTWAPTRMLGSNSDGRRKHF